MGSGVDIDSGVKARTSTYVDVVEVEMKTRIR